MSQCLAEAKFPGEVVPLTIGASLQPHRHNDVAAVAGGRFVNQHTAVAIAQEHLDIIGIDGIQHVQQVGNIEADHHGLMVITGIELFYGLFLIWFMCLNFNFIF